MEDLLSVDIGFVFNSHSGDGRLLMVSNKMIFQEYLFY